MTFHPQRREKVGALIGEFQDIFSRGEFDLGETALGEHAIDTGDARPIRQQMRRHPRHLQDEIDSQVAKMMEAGDVEPSRGPWASNVVMVRKHDGSYRLCVDLRGVNAVTRKDAFPLPRISSCLDALVGSRYYSTFDLTSGYYQVRMDPADADKTAFLTRQGLFRYRKMTMGLCNAGSTFSRVMQLAMEGLNPLTCLVYLDDIIVHSIDVASHVVKLRSVFLRLRKAGLKLKPSKCHLIKEKVAFLGHVVSAEGVATDPGKVQSVQDWPTPVNIRDVRAFVGLASYYRRFIVGFAQICGPLHALTGKNARFHWSDDCRAAFEALKIALTSAPVLAMPTEDDHFVLDTDASDFSIGADPVATAGRARAHRHLLRV